MPGIKSQFYTDIQLLEASHLNAGGRWTGKTVQELLAEFFFDDTGSGTTSRILGGLKWTITPGTLNMVLTQGAAAWKHGGGLSSIINTAETVPETVCATVAGDTLAFSANASGNDRIDLVVIDWSLVTDLNISQPQEDPLPNALQDVRWGPATALSVVEGTPAASPSPPALSATQQSIYQVDVPDGTNAGNFDSVATIRETAQTASVGRLGPGHAHLQVDMYSTAEERRVISCQREAPNDDGVHALRFRFADPAAPDLNLDYFPIFERPASMGANEAAAALYPLVNPGGREWTTFVPFASGNWRWPTNGGGLDHEDYGLYVRIKRNAVTTEQFEWNRAIELPDRSLQLVQGVIHWEVIAAFDGTILNQSFTCGLVDHTGTLAALTSLPSPGLGSTGAKSSTFTPSNRIVGNKEAFFAGLAFGLQNDGTAVGEIRLYGVELTFREARA